MKISKQILTRSIVGFYGNIQNMSVNILTKNINNTKTQKFYKFVKKNILNMTKLKKIHILRQYSYLVF